uniref:Mutator-like transposase domain-containing protein n=1 Tax=Pectinophora gossypiella TaxID=13191 RepID=A0A1E1WM45_PECGO
MRRKLPYKKHQYCGTRSNKRSRAILKYHHGVESRVQAWRKDERSRKNTEQPFPVSAADDCKVEAFSWKPLIADYTRIPLRKREASLQQNKDEKDHIEESTSQLLKPSCEENPLEIGYLTPNNDNRLKGYRIVDINHVLNWSLRLQQDHSSICPQGQIEFIREERIGLFSTFIFHCTVCNSKIMQTSEPSDNQKINKACVLGTQTSGTVCTQINQLFTEMDIPTMSPNMFIKEENDLSNE